MERKAVFLLIAVSIVGLGIALWSSKLDGIPAERPSFGRATIVITRKDGKSYPFKMEVARSKREQAYGLMFISSMPDDEGMIFPFDPPRDTGFWMKNTYIPLDMLFVRPDGTIGRIEAQRQPQDVTPVYAQEPVKAVIEINGGLARKYGIEAGNKVQIQ